MKVALLGAPGSGKTKIGRRIVRRLNTGGPVFPPPAPVPGNQWRIIDGYVDSLRDGTGRSFGAVSSLQDNLIVASKRWIQEDEYTQKGISTVTCGSLYETIIYSAYPSMLIPMMGDEEAILSATHLAEVTMSILGALEILTVDYDALFLLPAPNVKVDTWDNVVNAKLMDVLLGFNRVPVILDGTDRQKVDRATEVIRTIASALTEDEQQAGPSSISASS